MNLKIVRKFVKSFKLQKGFTLIELLVVIGILGILASALIATIDPFEQLKKAQDANSKNTAVEYQSANIRFFTTHSTFPWQSDAGCIASAGGSSMVSMNVTTMSGCTNALISDGELKASFTSATNIIQNILVTGSATSVITCFLPSSKSQQRDPNAKYDKTGVVTTGCASTSGQVGTYCYWCAL